MTLDLAIMLWAKHQKHRQKILKIDMWDHINLKTSVHQKTRLTGEKGNLQNGTRCLQIVYLIRS